MDTHSFTEIYWMFTQCYENASALWVFVISYKRITLIFHHEFT